MDLLKTGKFIKEHRDKLGLSQRDLSEKVHVTRQAVSNWENGKTLPDSDVLLSLSDLFHVTINDILCGETIEGTLLELVDETNKKTNRIKKMMLVFTSIISILLISFLVFYFITNYNSIKVYTVSSSSEHFRIVDGIIISTSSNTYFKLGRVDIKNDKELSVSRMKLYYEKGNKREIIFEDEVNDRLHIDKAGYKELYRKEFDKYKNHLYLEIKYNDHESEILKLKVLKDFSNDLTIMFDESMVLKNKNTKEIQDRIDNLIKEENIEFEKNVQVRKDLIFTPIITEPVSLKQEVIVSTPIVEQSTKQEEEPSTPVEIEEPIEETLEEPIEVQDKVPEEINYEEIFNIIETYGISIGRFKQLEYMIDDEYIMIRYSKTSTIIEVESSDVIETFSIRERNSYYATYQMVENNNEVEKIEGALEELQETNPSLIERMNNYLMLVYQEIK
ncbi:MAG: helix-turn-helix transcriptional regulator [Bacilli bacterium]|nr:helix-turn-helix transcriptional regulator [Bacilli bacterium]